jgi:DNA-binding transcriptional LysR family regulator
MDRPVFTEIKKLRTFVAIAEERSFTKAAARLNAAQPWVSDQLKQLELWLGLELIIRAKGKPIRITPAGEDILRIANRLLLSCADAAEDMQRCRDEGISRLVLGVEAPTLFIPERNRLIARFQDRARGTKLEIVSSPPDELSEGLCDGRFDLILTSARRPSDDIEALPFFECELLLAVPKGSASRYRSAREGRLRRTRLMALRDRAHPWLPALKAQLADEQIDWVDCPEDSFPALIHYAATMGIATLAPALPDQIDQLEARFELWPIKGRALRARWSLMRRRGYQKSTRDLFWRLAATSEIGHRDGILPAASRTAATASRRG